MAEQQVLITPGTGSVAADFAQESTSQGLRQIITIGDPTVKAGQAQVENADPGATDYGLVVRPLIPTTKPAAVQGTVADAATAGSNPVPVGGIFHASAPTYTDGQRTQLQSDVNGNLKTTLSTRIAGEDIANDVLKTGIFHSSPITAADGTAYALQLDANGYLKVNVVVGSAGGSSSVTYNSTPPTLTNGQSTGLQGDTHANLMVSLGTKIAGEDITNDVLKVEQQYSTIAYSTTQSAVTIKSGAGRLHTLTILGGTLGALTVWDNTAGSGTTLLPVHTPGGAICYVLDIPFVNGLTFTTATAMVLVFSYR